MGSPPGPPGLSPGPPGPPGPAGPPGPPDPPPTTSEVSSWSSALRTRAREAWRTVSEAAVSCRLASSCQVVSIRRTSAPAQLAERTLALVPPRATMSASLSACVSSRLAICRILAVSMPCCTAMSSPWWARRPSSSVSRQT
ncbi:MAG TPA: hypothetical protein DER11_05335 [Janibacter terrae]|nr:hypothetical protein [Janibacter terrae]